MAVFIKTLMLIRVVVYNMSCCQKHLLIWQIPDAKWDWLVGEVQVVKVLTHVLHRAEVQRCDKAAIVLPCSVEAVGPGDGLDSLNSPPPPPKKKKAVQAGSCDCSIKVMNHPEEGDNRCMGPPLPLLPPHESHTHTRTRL